ncbi:MAG: hypothetical protein HY047_07890 [Acidobacteria bacterium]|nr:hypothetical protein [Acidobacteriota bacterium]
MIRCKEVATLLDTEQVADESLWTRIGVRLHLIMCRNCRRFVRQLRQLRVGARSIRSGFDAEASAAGLEPKIVKNLQLTSRDPRE